MLYILNLINMNLRYRFGVKYHRAQGFISLVMNSHNFLLFTKIKVIGIPKVIKFLFLFSETSIWRGKKERKKSSLIG